MTDRWDDSDPLRDMLVEMGQLPAPKRRFDLADILVGWRVFDNERQLVGKVGGHIGEYLVVRRTGFAGHFSWLSLYVPASAIAQAREGAVLLNVPRDWMGGLGWGRPPRKPPARWQHS